MMIKKNILEMILNNQPTIPPEKGGILGGTNKCVSKAVFDNGIENSRMCSYAPNTAFLNWIINNWYKEGINFMGIFHTHFFDVNTLSDGDIKYIERIMKNMPPYISTLYFPLVIMPTRKMQSYKAAVVNKRLFIKKDILTIK